MDASISNSINTADRGEFQIEILIVQKVFS